MLKGREKENELKSHEIKTKNWRFNNSSEIPVFFTKFCQSLFHTFSGTQEKRKQEGMEGILTTSESWVEPLGPTYFF